MTNNHKNVSNQLLKLSLVCLFSVGVLSQGAIAATHTTHATTLTTGKDEQSLLPYWQIEEHGMSIRFVQRLPDQARAFFLARGFSDQDSEHIATSCAFQTVLTNTSHKSVPSPLNFDLRDWVVNYKGWKSGIKAREDWAKEWEIKGISRGSELAFKWSLVPTQMEYQPNDYNWGISFFNLKPGSVFDLKVVWWQYDKMHSYVIKGIQCAADIHPNPETFGDK